MSQMLVLYIFLALLSPLRADPCAPPDGLACDLSSVTTAIDPWCRDCPPARIGGFWSPQMDSTGKVDLVWHAPGDTVTFEMVVDARQDLDPRSLLAEVWTNTNENAEPGNYRAVPMSLVRREGGRAFYQASLPIDRIGNYRAVGRVSTDGGRTWRWMSEDGFGDVRFRPRDDRHDRLNIMEINVGNVNYDARSRRFGTFADMTEAGSPDSNGRYTLEWLARQGKNAIWLMPPFEVSKWDQRHPMDDAGSPYAAKDFFSVSTELSRNARGKTGEEARQAALDEFRAFVDKAHALGIKVILDVALNHVGHDYEFRDLFVSRDEQGREHREVRRNDFSQVVTDESQRARVRAALADGEPDTMERVAPWMYGSNKGDPHGARDLSEKAPGGWFEWHDTAQLNHGRFRSGYHWWDIAPTPENAAVQGWLTRVLDYWAVDMGVDGFRLDHITGLPLSILENGANRVQADVDAHRPGETLFWMGEDFHTGQDTRNWLDAGQGGWFHEFFRVRDPGSFQNVVDNPWFHDLLNLDSHDEERFIHAWEGNERAALRMAGLLQLVGGPVAEVAGDEFGARDKLAFKQYTGVREIQNLDDRGRWMAEEYRRVGAVRSTLPELLDDNRHFLSPAIGGPDPDIVAMTRWADAPKDPPVFVFSNLNDRDTRENLYPLDPESRRRLDPGKRYQVRDLLSKDRDALLWREPKTGKQLLDEGIYTKLDPYQTQVLDLVEVP